MDSTKRWLDLGTSFNPPISELMTEPFALKVELDFCQEVRETGWNSHEVLEPGAERWERKLWERELSHAT